MAGAARLCIDRGAAVNHPDRLAPLIGASWRGHADAVRLLLERGADIDVTFRGKKSHEVARNAGRATLAVWLARIQSWTRHLAEPRYALAVLRALVARGWARRQRAFFGKERVLDFVFPGDRPRGGRPGLPDDLFPLVARYYWGGGMWAEEEAAAAAEAATRQARAEDGDEDEASEVAPDEEESDEEDQEGEGALGGPFTVGGPFAFGWAS